MPLSTSQLARQKAESKRNVASADTDEAKYAAAVDAARKELAGRDDVSRDEFRNAIDKVYSQSGAKKSARELRGQNAFTDFVDTVNNGINGFNTAIGNAIDFGWDNIVGGIANGISKEFGDDVKNFGKGEDLALIPDIASDVLLTMSGVGIPFVVAKELFRNADNWHDSFIGKDAITLEDLDAGQRAMKGAMGLGTTALSALPGIGKIKSIAKAVNKEATAETASKAANAFDDATKKLADAGTKKEAAAKALEEKEAAKAASTVTDADQIAQMEADIAEAVKGKSSAEEAYKQLEETLKQAEEAKKESARLAAMSTPGRVAEVLKEDLKGAAKGIGEAPSTFGKAMGDVRASKKLASGTRKANKAVKEGKDANVTYEQAFKDVFESSPEVQEAAKRLGIGDSFEDVFSALPRKVVGETAGAFAPGQIQYARRGFPGIKYSTNAAAKNVGEKTSAGELSLSERLRDMRAYKDKAEDIVEKYGEDPEGLDKIRRNLAEYNLKQSMSPTSAKNRAIQTALGMGLSFPLMVAGDAAESGTSFEEAAANLMANRRPAAILASVFPAFSGRSLAFNSIPNLRGRSFKNSPYYSLRAADTINQSQMQADERPDRKKA